MAALVVGIAGAAWAALLDSVPAIPVPQPIVVVHTESGGVSRDTNVPVGGVPTAIDVDDKLTNGQKTPDIDVSVGMVATEELPSGILVPNVVVRRNAQAVARGAAAPPLDLNARIVLLDGVGGSRLATVDYGFETPAGARMPPLVKAKLVGPPQGGFVDPLVAKIDTPGYGGPLRFAVDVTTETMQARFGMGFDPLPESISITEDPRADGLDLVYDQPGPPLDVKFDTTADLRELDSGRTRHIAVGLDRLPRQLKLAHTSSADRTVLEYTAGSALAKPDVDVAYSDTLGDGRMVVDAKARISGLPGHLLATVSTRPSGEGTDIDGVRVQALESGQIDALDFDVRNWSGSPAPVPMHDLGPDHMLAMVSRKQSDGTSRFRMAGRLSGVREVGYQRGGEERDALDVTADFGDGRKALRGVLDIDDRGAQPKPGEKRHFVDTSVDPLPSRMDIGYRPASATGPLQLLYESAPPPDPATRINVDTRTVIAEGQADACGEDRVVCAVASVEDLPRNIDVQLPGQGGTDFTISHDSPPARDPDLSARIDLGPDSSETPAAERKWISAGLDGLPSEVRGRIDTRGGELTAAEFHGCEYDFTEGACKAGTQGAIEAVRFIVRDQPARTGLPPRPDVASQHVTLVSRDQLGTPKHFEVAGRVNEVRNVAFRQLDRTPGDGRTDGVLGAEIDVGSGGEPFDVFVDEVGVAVDDSKPPKPIGDELTEVGVRVDPLPAYFQTCVRKSAEVAPPDPSTLPRDTLLQRCLTTDVVRPGQGEHPVTPLSAHYEARNRDGSPSLPEVDAHVKVSKPDEDDPDEQDPAQPIDNTLQLDVGVLDMPANLDIDVIPPVTPDRGKGIAGRRLQAIYDADSPIPRIGFDLQRRRTNSACQDPRPRRKALCLSGTLTNLPDRIETTYDPDDASGLVDVVSTPPAEGQPKLSLLPLRLSRVSPEEGAKPIVLDARIKGITPHLEAHIQSLELDGENPPGNLSLAQQLATCSNVDGSGEPIDDDGDQKANSKDSDCERDTARLAFDACPDTDDDSGCPGIESIVFNATDQLVPDPQPANAGGGKGPFGNHIPPLPSLPVVDEQGFSFVQAGEFHATGDIRNFKTIEYAKVDKDGHPSRVSRMSASLGNGDPLKVLIDRDTGRKREKVDAVITRAPQRIDLCFREPTVAADLVHDSQDFCETDLPHPELGGVADKLALQAEVTPSGSEGPTIDVRDFEFSKGGGTEVLKGSFKIEDLAERIDVLQGKGSGTELLVEGHHRDDPPRGATPQAVAGRFTFSIRNFRDLAGLTEYPWDPLDPDSVDPEDESRNQGNYVQLIKSHDSLLAKGSVPDIRRVQVTPRPCRVERDRTPDPAEFHPGHAPEYKCVKAITAPGKPLGLSVRTLKGNPGSVDVPPDLEALSVDDGHISKMPESLEVTIAKSPDEDKALPRCSDSYDPNADPGIPSGGRVACRPPLISMEAPPAAQGAGTLEARLATGKLPDLKALRDAQPIDVLSQRIGFEDRPASPDFGRGARIKVGSNQQTGGTAIRMAAKLTIPRFLDLDPLAQWDCTHLVEQPNLSTGCADDDVGSEHNDGYESRDVLFRMVAADDHHYGNPSGDPFLGRVAVMLEPLFEDADASPKDQVVLSGMPAPNNVDMMPPEDDDGGADQLTQGASSHFAERLWSPVPEDRGFNAPAHLDARLYFRNDYNSDEATGRNQINFTQIDGRVNAPVSLALRINDRPEEPDPNPIIALIRGPLSTNRADQLVPTTHLRLYNAPSAPNPSNTGSPTFRIRSELRKGFQSPPKPREGELFDSLDCNNSDLALNNSTGVKLCGITPANAKLRYIDAQLNADPYSNGATTTADAARTVDFVGGPFGGTNNVEARGFREVRGGGDKGPGADMTTAAALRLTNFETGLRIEAGLLVGVGVDYKQIGDLIVGATGNAVQRMRIGSENWGAKLASAGGRDPHDFSRVTSDLESHTALKLSLRTLFGSLTLFSGSIGPYDQPIDFDDCDSFFSEEDRFWTGPPGPGERKVTMALGMPESFSGISALPLTLIGELLNLGGCQWSPSTAPMIGTSNSSGLVRSPLPSYRVNAQPVPDAGITTAHAEPAPPQEDPPVREDLTVPFGDMTLCGPKALRNLTVQGTVRVGAPGATDVHGAACDGSLAIDADRIVVTSTGRITAAGIMTGGPGQPASGAGGGAGHRGGGGASGSGGPGGSPSSEPQRGPAADLGSQGRAGGAAAGKGGGAIVLSADSFVNDGTITAAGDAGNPAPAAGCATGGGGGSGGAVAIAANLIEGTGTLDVSGGKGGDGGFGGGGGSGGRLTRNTVGSTNTDAVAAVDGGSGDAACGAETGGKPGAAGVSAGQRPTLASGARFHDRTLGSYTQQKPLVDITAVFSNVNLPVEVFLCHRNAPFSDVEAFGRPTDPSGSDTVEQVTQGAVCGATPDTPTVVHVPPPGNDRPHVATWENVSPRNVLDGVYGFYTYARQVECGLTEGGTQSRYNVLTHRCEGTPAAIDKPPPLGTITYHVQDPLPDVSRAKVGIDLGAPVIDSVTGDGSDGCPALGADKSRCQTGLLGQVTIDARDSQGGAGLRSITCRVVRHGEAPGAFGDCSARPTPLGLGEGLNRVDVMATDLAGRTAGPSDDKSVRWFVDTHAPKAPTLELTPQGPAPKNGWSREWPFVRVQAFDPGPSSGFVLNDGLTLYVDEGKSSQCKGGSDPGTLDHINGRTECGLQLDLDEGEHRLTATATDRVGLTSGLSDGHTVRVDNKPPVSRLTLGPREPDGRNGWYRVRPFLAFSASDGAGGSGVRPELDADGVGTGIKVRVDPATTFEDYDPDQPIRLDDGEHRVCWYAVDVAGNTEDLDPATPEIDPHCKENIKVDTTPPTAADAIDPAGPDGAGGWYVTRPEVTMSGDDPHAPGVAFSGLDRVEYQVDDGPWTPAAPFRVEQGEHLVRVRAFDNAGNVAELVDRAVRVDLEAPRAGMTAFPPAPNALGLWRRQRVHAVTAQDERGGSGPDAAEFSIDGGLPAVYAGPFEVPAGFHRASAMAVDRAGRSSASVTQASAVDLGAPGAEPSSTPAAPITSSSPATTLHFTTSDAVPPGDAPASYVPRAKPTVVVYNAQGAPIRRLPVAGPHPGGYSSTGAGSVTWDGKNQALRPVPSGQYHYRVQATDQAGNTITSTESRPFTVSHPLVDVEIIISIL